MRRAIFACAALGMVACGNVEDPVTGPAVDDGADSAAAVATVARTRHTLGVTLLGTAGGDGVTSSPAGIDCHDGGAGPCVASFDAGTVVTLTATPGLIFWEAPGCSFDRTCTVTMSADMGILAHFD